MACQEPAGLQPVRNMLSFFIPAAALRTLWTTLRKFYPSSGSASSIFSSLQMWLNITLSAMPYHWEKRSAADSVSGVSASLNQPFFAGRN